MCGPHVREPRPRSGNQAVSVEQAACLGFRDAICAVRQLLQALPVGHRNGTAMHLDEALPFEKAESNGDAWAALPAACGAEVKLLEFCDFLAPGNAAVRPPQPAIS